MDVSHNKLKQLPENIGNLQCLKKLDLTHNNLRRLPTNICHAQRLVDLNLDSENFEYPPQEVVERGREAILQYICDGMKHRYCLIQIIIIYFQDIGVEYKKVQDLEDVLANLEESVSNIDEDDKLWQVSCF